MILPKRAAAATEHAARGANVELLLLLELLRLLLLRRRPLRGARCGQYFLEDGAKRQELRVRRRADVLH